MQNKNNNNCIYQQVKFNQKNKPHISVRLRWELTGSNRRPLLVSPSLTHNCLSRNGWSNVSILQAATNSRIWSGQPLVFIKSILKYICVLNKFFGIPIRVGLSAAIFFDTKRIYPSILNATFRTAFRRPPSFHIVPFRKLHFTCSFSR